MTRAEYAEMCRQAEMAALYGESPPYKLNRDQATRDQLVFGRPMTSDLEYFEDMDAPLLARLIAERFADPSEQQNEAYPIKDFLAFMEVHPWTRAHGYVVDLQRGDYRVSVEGLAGVAPSKVEADAFLAFCKHADELSGKRVKGSMCRAWWD